MNPKPPILDNRNMQDILRQLQELAKKYMPAWQPSADGDAGTTLQRIFARLMELGIQRLNRVPEKHLLAFLDTIGVSPLPPNPARVPLTFGLLPGAGPTFVPRGTQAGAGPVVFETADDLTVLPARLKQASTMDPVWDRFTDHSAALAARTCPAFTPFVGSKRMPHILYLGGEDMLDFARATVELRMGEQPVVGSKAAFLRTLAWHVRLGGQMVSVEPHPDDPFRLTLSGPVDREIITGVGLSVGVPGRWLRATLQAPLTDLQAEQFEQPAVNVTSGGLLPDITFSNSSPVDQTREFYPFGVEPKLGDTFYIASREVFSKPGADVIISLHAKPPQLDWEYWNGSGWVAFEKDYLKDETKGFLRSGAVRFVQQPADFQPCTIGGKHRYWFRTRFRAGRYPGTSRIVALHDTTAITTLQEDAHVKDTKLCLADTSHVSEGKALRIREEFFRVVRRIDASRIEITPEVRQDHAAHTAVEILDTADPSVVNREIKPGDESFCVDGRRITSCDVLLLEPPAVPEQPPAGHDTAEFVVAHGVERTFDAVNGRTLVTVVDTASPLAYHSVGTRAKRLVSRLLVLIDGREVNTLQPFFPFGEQSEPGRLVYFATPDAPPDPLELEFQIETISPTVDLTWEILTANGWDSTPFQNVRDQKLLSEAHFKFTVPIGVIAGSVNGKASYWVRVRIDAGGYGTPLSYEPVDAADLSRGYQVKRGTGNIMAPLVTQLTLLSYQLARCPTALIQNGFFFEDRTSAGNGRGLQPFVSIGQLPEPYRDSTPTLYLGFDALTAGTPVLLHVAAAVHAFTASVFKDPLYAERGSLALTPLRWEYYNGTRWTTLTLFDRSNHLTESGPLEFLTPQDIAPLAKFDLIPRYWIRALSSVNDPVSTPRLQGVFLNTVEATQTTTVESEVVGSGSGQPDQRLQLRLPPVVEGQEVIVREAEAPSGEEQGPSTISPRSNAATSETGVWIRWQEVPNFVGSGPRSRHYTLDHTSGLLAFGDGKRGLIPPRGAENISARYRTTGGAAGNQARGAVAQVRSPIPGIASVVNPAPADGGADAETVFVAQERGPHTLKSRNRAVAADDLEWLARQAAGARVARAKCLPNINRELRFEPGWLTLLIVPNGLEGRLAPSSELIREVETYVGERAFVGLAGPVPNRINVIGPGYIQVSVEARVVPHDIDQAEFVNRRITAAIDTFLHPLTGGPDGNGWEFARNVYVSEVCQVLEGVAGVSYVKELRLVPNAAQHRLELASGLQGRVAFSENCLNCDRRSS